MTKSRIPTENMVDEEHRRLHEEIDRFREWWTECREMGKPRFGEMGGRVGLLRGRLAEHFAWEEEGGYFHEVFDLAPEFAVRAESLCRQHASLLDAFDRLDAELRTPEPPFEGWTETGDRLRELLDRLEKHEAAETELVHMAVQQDVGTKD